MLTWNFFCRPGWPLAQRDGRAFVSGILELKTLTPLLARAA